jgi:AICAR transformylase/IMP cyclohydrolase PurH
MNEPIIFLNSHIRDRRVLPCALYLTECSARSSQGTVPELSTLSIATIIMAQNVKEQKKQTLKKSLNIRVISRGKNAQGERAINPCRVDGKIVQSAKDAFQRRLMSYISKTSRAAPFNISRTLQG